MGQGTSVTESASADPVEPHLERASAAIEDALEAVDFETEPERASALISAVDAIERARTAEDDSEND